MNRVQIICKYCDKKDSAASWCNLLDMQLSMASISADCPFEDLDESNIKTIPQQIKEFEVMKSLQFLRDKE